MQFTKTESLSHEILCKMQDLKEVLVDFIIDPPHTPYQVLQRLEPDNARKRVSNALTRLRKRGLLKKVKHRDAIYIAITEKGRVELARLAVRQKQKKKWDGKWRLVIFDIPETTRADRDFLRTQLKWFGFLELQKSVWISPYNVKQELQKFLRLCRNHLLGDIRFLTVEEIDADQDLRKHFKF